MATRSAIDTVCEALSDPGRASSDFDLNPGFQLPQRRVLRAAGVLVPLQEVRGAAHVILTKRASGLKHHPGQIAFPGGKQDAGDASVEAAALREAHEEIGLKPASVDVLGHLPLHETVTGFQVTPVVARITGAFTPVAEPGEVAEIFAVPLAHLLAPANYQVQSRMWRGERRHFYVVPWGPYYIWGATARILRGLADRVQK